MSYIFLNNVIYDKKRKKKCILEWKSFLIVNLMISMIVHLPLRSCQLRRVVFIRWIVDRNFWRKKVQQMTILGNSLFEKQRILRVWLEKHPRKWTMDVKVKIGLLRKMSVPKGVKLEIKSFGLNWGFQVRIRHPSITRKEQKGEHNYF